MSETWNWLQRVWFGLSVLALAILYLLFEKRGRDISKLRADAEFALIDSKLDELKARASSSNEEREKANAEYQKLRRIHGALLDKLGLGGRTNPPSQ